jgi:hypothetical protein
LMFWKLLNDSLSKEKMDRAIAGLTKAC